MLEKLKNLKKINLLKLFKLDKFQKRAIFLLVIFLVILINFFISPFSIRYDMSYGKAYTLSPSTKKILKKLDSTVDIKFFVSSNLPSRIIPAKTQINDLLNEYKKTSSKINLKILDPKKDEKIANEAKETGIPELQFSQVENDKYAVSAVYFGLLINYKDKKEIIPQLTDLGNLEYNLTSLIYKLTNKDIPKIGTIGEEDGLLSFNKIMSQQFNLVNLKIPDSPNENIDKTYKTIIVYDNNKKTYDEKEINQIKNYLDGGGKAVFFVDGVWLDDKLTPVEAKHDLFSLFSDWGINLNKNFALSTSSELVNFGNGYVSFLTPYPFWLKTNNFNASASYFSNVSQLIFPWTSSVSLNKKSGIESTVVVKSSKKSWEQKNNYILNPNSIPQPKVSDLKEFNLIAFSKNKKGGELVLVPTSRFVLDKYQSQTSGNLEFILNILNDLSSGGALSGIRSRALVYSPLPDLNENQKDIFKYLNILLLPGLLAIFAGMRLIKRK